MILPVFENDPLEWLRPTPESSVPLFNHWHEIALSFVFYVAVQSVSPAISRKMFGKAYSDLNMKNRINFDIHVVSMVQCVISLSSLAPMWNHSHFQNRANDPINSVFGYSPYGGFVASLTVGYFLWDVYVCARWFDTFGFGFLFHGIAALYVFGCSLVPFVMPWIPAFLLFELSTPFVNINFFASKLPANTIDNTIVVVNGILLLITFFSVRIVWGFYAVSLVAYDFYLTWGMINPLFPIITIVLNLSLDCLNLFWFYKMVRIAKKKLSTPKQYAEIAAKDEVAQ